MADELERCYRHCSPAHQDIGDATLAASQSHGGRFNPRGEYGALYLSCDRGTAVAELRRRADRLAIELSALLPRSILTVDLRLGSVLDLTDPDVRAEWGLDEHTLAADDFTPCQEVGRAARREGFEAIRYPSATGAGKNLVVFLDRLHPGSRAQVVDAQTFEASDADPEEPTFPGLNP